MYYDGTKILSYLDINGNKPTFYLVTGNRTAGKTTYFERLQVNRFIKKNKKFIVLYRYEYELINAAEQYFKDIGALFFPDYEMTSMSRAKSHYYELFLNKKSCGYALAINGSDTIKRFSHVFSDVDSILFDEFQSESGNYCPNEITKFLSILKSVSRGQGEQYRYVPVYMLSNPVTILNPYFVKMGISTRLKNETKFLKGDGWILEQCYNESAAMAQSNSGIDRAFPSEQYISYSSEGTYLNDSLSFIDTPKGNSIYMCTLKIYNTEFGIREFVTSGLIYCSYNVDSTCNRKICVTTDDHEINYVMLKKNDYIIRLLRYYFSKGCFRFKDLTCKDAVISALSL